MMKIKYMNYDITLSLSETLNIKIFDTHTYNIYDRTFTKIEEITKFNGLTLTHAHNIFDSFFNRKNPNIAADIKKSQSDEKLCISLTYTKKDDFNITVDIFLIFELNKKMIDDTEKRYSQLLYKITSLEATISDMMKIIDRAEICIKRVGHICISRATTRLIIQHIAYHYDPYTIGNYISREHYDETTNTLFLHNIDQLLNFSGINIEELNITGNFCEIKIQDIPTVKKLSCNNIISAIPIELNGSFLSLEELSIINWANLKTIKNQLPKKKLKIILQNISTELKGEIPILKELGYTIECK